MNISIRNKFLIACLALVLLTVINMSAAYYFITKGNIQRETRQRIQIAFDIILDDYENRARLYIEKFDEFLAANAVLCSTASLYAQDASQLQSKTFIVANLGMTAERFSEFGELMSADTIALYGADKRLLAVYQHSSEGDDISGVYAMTDDGRPTFLFLEDPLNNRQLASLLLDDNALAEYSLPESLLPAYEGDIPDSIQLYPLSREGSVGMRIVAPVLQQDKKIGVFVGDILYTQAMVEHYAELSQNAVNFFAGDQLSIGTLPEQAQLESHLLQQFVRCEDIFQKRIDHMELMPVTFSDQDYYQAGCVFRHADRNIGAITISLSQDLEHKEIKKILTTLFSISGIAVVSAIVLSIVFSRNTIKAIHNIVHVIGSAAEGDLRPMATVTTHDEIGMLAGKLNRMIFQFRDIASQARGASLAVGGTADTILQQMETLLTHMEQQSSSVDNTTEAIEVISQFIDAVSNSTGELLLAAARILSSIQETRANISEVTTITGTFTTDLQLISSSVEQVNGSARHISDNTGDLAGLVQQAETEIHRIDESLKDVSHNADRTQQLAHETMKTVRKGQTSVDASIQGMKELKDVVSNTASIIHEVNSWGERVSSILGIVDEITEQTSLLALNASIISAQAGSHGRGFSVVADEIKELATRTKDSTKEISTLVHELRMKTREGVKQTVHGLQKADQGMQLANAVQEALTTILESATRSSQRAADTVQVIQQTAESSQSISHSMSGVTDMVSSIRGEVQEQAQDIEKVFSAVENISIMSEQVNRAAIEQNRAAEEIEVSMTHITEQFYGISEQTEKLQQNSTQIVEAMHTIELSAEHILQNTNAISGESVKNLIRQSELLQRIVKVFKL